MSQDITAKAQAGLEVLHKLNLFDAGAKPEIGSRLLELSVTHLFGTVWANSTLPIEQRSIITIATLIALGREAELHLHFRGARNLGVSKEVLEEIIVHVAHYAGWPVAVSANRILNSVWESLDKQNQI